MERTASADDRFDENEVHEGDSTAVNLPDSSDASEGEGGKFKMIVQLFKRCLGVKDIAALYVIQLYWQVKHFNICDAFYRRLSLPASLLEPIPNLEYWHYLDRPDLFAA